MLSARYSSKQQLFMPLAFAIINLTNYGYQWFKPKGKSLQVTSDIISKISSPLNGNSVAKSINDHFESDYNID